MLKQGKPSMPKRAPPPPPAPKKFDEDLIDNLAPKKKDLQEVLKEYINQSSDDPVPYSASFIFMPFLHLYILKKNKNDCHTETYDNTYFLTAGKKKVNINIKVVNVIKDSYIRCKNRNKMLVIPLLLPGHQNLLVFNYHRDEVERFEPHGKRGDTKGSLTDNYIKKIYCG